MLIILVIAIMVYDLSDSEKKDERKDGELITIGFSQVGAESDWRVANTESIKSALTEENGFQLIYSDAQQKQENQIKAIKKFIAQDVDIIAFSPVTETGWEAVLRDAKEADIPVILLDRTIDVKDKTLYTCWIGSDFEKEGIEAANWLIQYTNTAAKKNENYHVVVLQGTVGSTAEIGRTKGFFETIESHDNIEVLEIESGDFTQAKGREVMESFLKKYDDIDVVVAQNDNMAFGAIDALKTEGKKPGTEVVVVSFDAVKAAFESMIAGEMNVSVECNPLQGPKLAEIVKRVLAEEGIEKFQYMEESVFTAETAAAEIANRKY